MYQFLESICVKDSKLLNLVLHQNRVNRTFSQFYQQKKPFNLEEIFKEIKLPNNKSKLRLLYNKDLFKIEIKEYIENRPKTLKIVAIKDYDYSYKFLDRSFIEKLKSESFDDILMIKNELVTDTSYANIAFFNGINWITPKTPLLAGTKREMLINDHSILEKDIKVQEIKEYKKFIIFNSMLEFNISKSFSVEGIKE